MAKLQTSDPPWFVAATEKTDDELPRVRHVVPERYEAYAKILHPIYELPDVDDRDLTWDEWERAKWEEEKQAGTDAAGGVSRSIRELTTWRAFPDTYEGAQEVSWRTLAERYGMAYEAELSNWSFKAAFGKSWPRYLAGAHEGELDPRPERALLECLHPYAEGRCRFWFSWADDWSEKERLAEATAEGGLFDLSRARIAGEAKWPSAIWPPDETWFVGSDIDLDFTLVGGPRVLIDAVLAHEVLETFEVAPSTEISRSADSANG